MSVDFLFIDVDCTSIEVIKRKINLRSEKYNSSGLEYANAIRGVD